MQTLYNSAVLYDNHTRGQRFKSRYEDALGEMMEARSTSMHEYQKQKKKVQDLLVKKNEVDKSISHQSIMSQSGVYDKYQSLSPKYDWNFGDSPFVGKKDFSRHREKYSMFTG